MESYNVQTLISEGGTGGKGSLSVVGQLNEIAGGLDLAGAQPCSTG